MIDRRYTLPSGKIVRTQGHEHFYLDEYFKNGGIEENIVVQPSYLKIIYTGEDDKSHRYYPDFYLKKENKVIEVKSLYTLNDKSGNISDMNIRKRQAVIDSGMDFEFKIY